VRGAADGTQDEGGRREKESEGFHTPGDRGCAGVRMAAPV
jgi:hypothetical protein